MYSGLRVNVPFEVRIGLVLPFPMSHSFFPPSFQTQGLQFPGGRQGGVGPWDGGSPMGGKRGRGVGGGPNREAGNAKRDPHARTSPQNNGMQHVSRQFPVPGHGARKMVNAGWGHGGRGPHKFPGSGRKLFFGKALRGWRVRVASCPLGRVFPHTLLF